MVKSRKQKGGPRREDWLSWRWPSALAVNPVQPAAGSELRTEPQGTESIWKSEKEVANEEDGGRIGGSRVSKIKRRENKKTA